MHPPVREANRIAFDATLIRFDRCAGAKVDIPVVQRACDAIAVDDALRQRPALVRAAVGQREHAIVGRAEDRAPRARVDASRDTAARRAAR